MYILNVMHITAYFLYKICQFVDILFVNLATQTKEY